VKKPELKIVGYSGFEKEYTKDIFEDFEAIEDKWYSNLKLGEPTSGDYCTDNLGEVEYDKNMLSALQTISWRRLDVEVRLAAFTGYIYLHSILINFVPKRYNFQLPVDLDLAAEAEKFVHCLGQIIQLDHGLQPAHALNVHKLMEQNKRLMEENALLKKELNRLKELLKNVDKQDVTEEKKVEEELNELKPNLHVEAVHNEEHGTKVANEKESNNVHM